MSVDLQDLSRFVEIEAVDPGAAVFTVMRKVWLVVVGGGFPAQYQRGAHISFSDAPDRPSPDKTEMLQGCSRP